MATQLVLRSADVMRLGTSLLHRLAFTTSIDVQGAVGPQGPTGPTGPSGPAGSAMFPTLLAHPSPPDSGAIGYVIGDDLYVMGTSGNPKMIQFLG